MVQVAGLPRDLAQQHRGDVDLPLPEPGVDTVEVASGQPCRAVGQIGCHHLPVEHELPDRGLSVAHHPAGGAHQVRAEAGPQVLRIDTSAQPLEFVQREQVADRARHPVDRRRAALDPQRVDPAQLGACPLGPGTGHPRDEGVDRLRGQFHARRVGAAAPRARPCLEQQVRRGVGTDLPQVHHGVRRGPVEPPLQRGDRGPGVLAVHQDVEEVGDRTAHRHQKRHRTVDEHQGGRPDQATVPARQHDPEPAGHSVGEPPRMEPRVALEGRGGGTAAVQRVPLGGEVREVREIAAEGDGQSSTTVVVHRTSSLSPAAPPWAGPGTCAVTTRRPVSYTHL